MTDEVPWALNQQAVGDVTTELNEVREQGNRAFRANDYTFAVEAYSGGIERLEGVLTLQKVTSGKSTEDLIQHCTGYRECRELLAVFFANRATSYAKLEQHGASLSDCQAGLELRNDYVKLWLRYASIVGLLKSSSEALKVLRKGCEACPRSQGIAKMFKDVHLSVKRERFLAAIAREDVAPSAAIDVTGMNLPTTYTGPKFDHSVTDSTIPPSFLEEILAFFGSEGRLPAILVVALVKRFIEIVKPLANVVDLRIPDGDQITVCGDVHGQFFDLQNLFKINGLPSETNRYVFNGDFVDRGQWSVECTLTLMAAKVIYPNHLHLARGNHETSALNSFYGFKSEVEQKYAKVSGMFQMYNLFSESFNWLPLAHLINGAVFCVHGGLPSRDDMSIDDLQQLNRGDVDGPIIQDLLWADPRDVPGRMASPRGISTTFGPDVTEKFCEHNKLKYIVRSHEVKELGHETQREGRCITIFSAPNYCDTMGNKGAFMRITAPEMDFEITEFDAVPHPKAQGGAMANPLLANL